MVTKSERKTLELVTERELKLLNVIRDIPYGKMELSVESNQPVNVVRIKENIKL